MPDPIPQHDTTWARALVEEMAARGLDGHGLLEGTGLTYGAITREGGTARFDRIVALFENVARVSGDDLIGLRMSNRFEFRRMGLIAYVGLTSPTLASFFRNVGRHFRVCSEAIDYDVSRLGTSGRLSWLYRLPAGINRRQYAEFAAAGIVEIARHLTGRRIVPLEVSFIHHRRGRNAEFARVFGCEVAFGQREYALRFKMSDLDLPLKTSDHRLHEVLVDYCRIVLAEKGRNVSSIVLDVEREVVDRLPSGALNQDEIARALGMSRRTLSRRLADAGTRFRDIVEELRKALAAQYLADSDLSVSEIAYLLGYSEVSSFSAAYRRWTGEAPSAARRTASRA